MNLSVIIPIYNVEKYIEECILSLENQDIDKTNYEIICVIDGSPDDSELVVRGLQKIYENIVIFVQDNKGVAEARNQGIRLARGKYILFVDPDDWVKENSFAYIINTLENENIDLLILNASDVKSNGEVIPSRVYFPCEQIMTSNEAYCFMNKHKTGHSDASCGIFIKTKIVQMNNIYFTKGICYLEDCEFQARLYSFASRILIPGIHFYNIRLRHDSANGKRINVTQLAVDGYYIALNSLLEFSDLERSNIRLSNAIVKFACLPTLVTPLSMISIWTYRYYKSKKIISRLDTHNCSRVYQALGNNYNRGLILFYCFNFIRSIKLKINSLINK